MAIKIDENGHSEWPFSVGGSFIAQKIVQLPLAYLLRYA